MTIPTAAGLADLAPRYDLFLVDQFGVLHDGGSAYPGAAEALRTLKSAGKRIVLISNSGRRAAGNESRLAALGFDRDSYDAFLSSGEVAWRMIADGALPRGQRRCLLINRRGDRSAVEGLDLELVARPEDADFLLITGSDADIRPLDDYRAVLAAAAARGLPCLCANPDQLMVLPGATAPGPGQFADIYAASGGAVTWIGKPYPAIYRHALAESARLGPAPPAHRVVGIGDSIGHDVAGARRAGFAAVLVTGGIHADDTPEALAAAIAAHDAAPDWLLARFAW